MIKSNKLKGEAEEKVTSECGTNQLFLNISKPKDNMETSLLVDRNGKLLLMKQNRKNHAVIVFLI